MEHNREDSPRKATQDEHSERDDKEEEVLVVPATDTVVHPRTVVVKLLEGVCVCVYMYMYKCGYVHVQIQWILLEHSWD